MDARKHGQQGLNLDSGEMCAYLNGADICQMPRSWTMHTPSVGFVLSVYTKAFAAVDYKINDTIVSMGQNKR